MRAWKTLLLCAVPSIVLAAQQGPPDTLPAPNSGAPAPTTQPVAQPQAAAAAQGQVDPVKTLTIDLASPGGTAVRSPGIYKLHFKNKIPSAMYTTESDIQSGSVSAPFSWMPKPSPNDTKDLVAKRCAEAEDSVRSQLKAALCEGEVSSIRATFPSKLASEGCGAEKIAEFAAEFTAVTEWTEDDAMPALVAGDTLFVKVHRDPFHSTASAAPQSCGFKPSQVKAENGGMTVQDASDKKWTFTTGKLEAQWLTYYGFNFARGGDQNYFSKLSAGSTPAAYTITAEADRSGKSFAPSLYVFRLPAKTGLSQGRWLTGWRTEDSMGGLTAGLGFDFDNPTVFLGYGVGWGYNVVLTAGVLYHKEKRLKGQYNPGDVIAENLTTDQLLDSTYKPRAYVGLAFRLDSNPFKPKSAQPAAAAK